MPRAPRTPANRQRSPGPQPPLTDRQRRALHAQRRALAGADILTDAGYRALLAEHPRETDDAPAGHCTSSTHLSRRQARQVITRLELMGARVGRPYSGARATAEATTALPTPAQRALIDRLRAEIPWRVGYDAWLHGRTSPTRGGDVQTYAHAEAVIEALRALRDRSAAEA